MAQALGYKELLDHVAGRASLDDALEAAISGPAASPAARSAGSVATPHHVVGALADDPDPMLVLDDLLAFVAR